MKRFLILASILMTTTTHAALQIPSGLTDGEQELVLQIIGVGTSFRPVNNPYPLGGYSGLELGVGVSSIPTGDIGYFGNHSTIDRNVVYPQFTLGKGIVESIDLFFNFMPFNENTGMGIYAGAVRWGFFQATFVPACFSLLVYGSNTNFNNIFISQSEGVDLIAGVNVDPLAFYIGAGTLYAQGEFDQSLTYNHTHSSQIGRSFHTILGINLSLNEVFAALEVDTYSTTTASFKLGARL